MEGKMPDHLLDTPEVSEDNITELFAADPQKLTDLQLNTISTTVRAKRSVWEKEDNSAKKDGRKANVGKGLKLDDLKLDLDSVQ
jgi:hypothetical protein